MDAALEGSRRSAADKLRVCDDDDDDEEEEEEEEDEEEEEEEKGKLTQIEF